MQLDILTIQGVGVDTLIIEGRRSVAICAQMPLKIVVDLAIIALDVNAPEDVGVFSSQAKLARTVAVLMHLGMRVDAAITTHATVYFFIFYKMKELNIIQSKLNAPKDLKNNFGNYFYRSCESILRALKPLLEETKCTLTITDEVVQVGERFYVKATASLKNEAGEVETTSAFAREPINKKGMDDSQVTGATSSYARKYALNGLFAIDDSRDSDVTNNGEAASAAGGKGANKELNAAIKELAQAKNEQELQAVWYKFPQFSNVNVFVAAYQQNNNKFIYGK